MIINANKAKPEQVKVVTPRRETQNVTPDPGYALSLVALNGDSNLKPSNIREGVNIFGYTGTHPDVVTGVIEPSSSSQSITITEAIGKSNIVILCSEDITISTQSVGLFYCAGGIKGEHYYQNSSNPYRCISNSVSWNSRTGKATVSYGSFSSMLEYRFFAW